MDINRLPPIQTINSNVATSAANSVAAASDTAETAGAVNATHVKLNSQPPLTISDMKTDAVETIPSENDLMENDDVAMLIDKAFQLPPPSASFLKTLS